MLQVVPVKIQIKFGERLLLFSKDMFHPLLNNHALRGIYKDTRSINVTGDYRALYTHDGEKVVFIAIGTHSELYE